MLHGWSWSGRRLRVWRSGLSELTSRRSQSQRRTYRRSAKEVGFPSPDRTLLLCCLMISSVATLRRIVVRSTQDTHALSSGPIVVWTETSSAYRIHYQWRRYQPTRTNTLGSWVAQHESCNAPSAARQHGRNMPYGEVKSRTLCSSHRRHDGS